ARRTRAFTREPPSFLQGGDGIVGEHGEILRVRAFGGARAALVVNEGADPHGGKEALQRVEIPGPIALRSMPEHHHRTLAVAGGKDESSRQRHVTRLERCLQDGKANPVSGLGAEPRRIGSARTETHRDSIRALGPSGGAHPSFPRWRERARVSVEAPPT